MPPRIVSWGLVDEWTQPLAIMETVFWEPDDTASLRQRIRESDAVHGKRGLEIGTGSGLLSLCCLQAGARQMVATDINPQAIQCAAYNAHRLGLANRIELRQVGLDAPGAFAVIEPTERFDLIVSNPPWEDQTPNQIAEFALYDPNFALLRSLLAGLRDHLTPTGRAWLAYGNVTGIRTLLAEAPAHGLQSRVLDERSLDTLPENFLPGMLIELVPIVKDPPPAPDTAPTHIIEK
ncbi:MAG: 50S ribosomal protein L11 methyltransferase [Planctomycetaceae bacterium]